MKGIGKKPGAGSLAADTAASTYPSPGKSTLTSALGAAPAPGGMPADPGKSTLTAALGPAPGGVPPVQRRALDSMATAVDGQTTTAATETEEASRTDEDWKPGTGTTKTTLNGTYGDFAVEHGLTKAPDPTKPDGWGDYSLKIEMTPNAKTGTSTIAFLQVVRRGEISGAWHTKATDPFMGAERAKRTDPKSGFKIDRYDATKAKTPFYGMQKSGSGVTELSNTHAGKHGGDKPWMTDTPGVGPNPENAEFIATATDQADGTQFDAVTWGYKYEAASKTYAEVTPVLSKAGSADIAGRDRAIKKWNVDVATTSSGIDKVPVKDDPVGTARTLSTLLAATKIDESTVTATLKAITDPDLRLRVAACYLTETGRKLADDLKTKLPAASGGGLADWTK